MPRSDPRRRLPYARRCLLPSLLWAGVALAGCDDKALPVSGSGGMAGGAPTPGTGGVIGVGGAAGPGGAGASSAGGAGGRGDSVDVACAGDLASRLVAVPLRPLDAFAYRNTVQSLVGVAPTGDQLPRDPGPGEGADDALARNVPAYHELAHDQALAISQDPKALVSLLGCDPSSQDEALCRQQLLNGFVTQAFRRPLASDEVADFEAVFAKGRMLGGTFASGVRAVVEVTLQSPEVLYRVEWGERVRPDVAGLGRPTPFEMASRLSYLVWGSPPDGALWAAAGQGGLRDPAEVGAQARRLLADPRAREGVRHVLLQWLDVPEPDGSATVLDGAFYAETRAFLDGVLWDGGTGTLTTLLTAPWSYLDPGLATFYGIDGITGAGLRRFDLPPLQRSGLFTQGSFLSAHPTPSQRGLFVRRQLLCGDTPDDPRSSATRALDPPPSPGESQRQYLARLTQAPSCQACHQTFDPLGFAFAHYDAQGAWRETEAGSAIDSGGALTSSDAAGPFDGAPSLLRRLADSSDVRACHVRKWMELAYGRAVEPADACSAAALTKAFNASGGNIPDLVWQLTQTEAFLARPVP